MKFLVQVEVNVNPNGDPANQSAEVTTRLTTALAGVTGVTAVSVTEVAAEA